MEEMNASGGEVVVKGHKSHYKSMAKRRSCNRMYKNSAQSRNERKMSEERRNERKHKQIRVNER